MSEPYMFPSIGAFRDRAEERAALDAWFEDDAEWRVMMLVGRRRVGKSWLFRAFAHGREADIFVASTRGRVDQLSGFAEQLMRDGERPALPDVESFLRLLYRRARDRRRLAVIDELPFLWTADRDLPSVMLKVIEEEAASSRLKLIVAGSHVGMMERLLAQREPLHDRLRPLPVRALDLWRAREMLDARSPEELLTAYAIAGGLPRYLAEVSGHGDPVTHLAAVCLDPRGSLFDEPRAILAQELEVPHTYFSILAALSSGPRPWGDLVSRSGIESSRLARYLRTLEDLELVKARMPITDAERSGRHRRYEIDDGFLRFWFRFVFPFQADLEAGLSPEAVLRAEILPRLADHLAPTIEEVARGWVRRTGFAGVTRVGPWWGPALDEHRATGERTNEEIDIVGTARGRVVVIGEVRWRNKPMDVGVLGEIERFKLPALRRVTTVEARPWVMLVSRSGFTDGLHLAASRDGRIRLVGLDELVAG